MKKAILIDEGNRSYVAQRFGIMEDEEDILPTGMYLVADFGESDEAFEIVEAGKYAELFEELGDIRNGFKSVELKSRL